MTILGASSAGPWAGLGFASVFTLVTGVYHLIRGRSWASPFLPQGRTSGAALFVGGLVLLFVAAAVSPDSGPDPQPTTPNPVSPSTATPTSAPTTIASSPSATQISSAAPPAASPAPTSATPAISVLETLPIKGRAPKTGYDRALFGQRWADVDRNGCDTRNDILRRDLANVTAKPGTKDCVVLTGTLADPYTGTVIDFTRGQDTSTEVHIDHVVALSDSWQKGAQQLDEADRTLLANDPLNLLAVQGRANMAKGDGDAATWLPSNKAFRCDYVARQVAVKARYGLWVTQAEHDAISQVLEQCPAQGLPDDDTDLVAPRITTPEPPPAPEDPLATRPATNVYYRNCMAARDAGAAPLLRGQPGYRSAMDGDNDGVACE